MNDAIIKRPFQSQHFSLGICITKQSNPTIAQTSLYACTMSAIKHFWTADPETGIKHRYRYDRCPASHHRKDLCIVVGVGIERPDPLRIHNQEIDNRAVGLPAL